MKKAAVLIVSLILFSYYSCIATGSTDTAATLFDSIDSVYVDSCIYAVTKSKEVILIEDLKENTSRIALVKEHSKLKEIDDFWGPPRYNVIINWTVKDSTLLILRGKSGNLDLRSYYINKDGGVAKGKNYFLEHHFLMSNANGGGYSYNAGLLWLDSDLYMYINGGQMYGGKVNGLYKYQFDKNDIQVAKPDTVVDNGLIRQSLPYISPNLKSIGFTEPEKYVMVYTVSEWGRKFVERFNSNENTEEDESKRLKDLKYYLTKPYHYRLMDKNDRKRADERSRMWNDNLVEYPLFSDYPHARVLNAAKTDSAEYYINEVLATYDKKNSGVELEGYIDAPLSHNIYFFCRSKKTKALNILIFDRYHGLWVIGKHTEIESKPRQLWFSAEDADKAKK